MPPPNPLPLNNQQALQDANASAAAITNPNNPLGSTLAPDLATIHNVGYANSDATGVASANVNIAQQQVTAAKEAAAAAKKAAQDAADPSKFQRIQKEDGGYQFLDGAGKEISASQYASALGISPDKVLKDSQNPIDIAFQQDYQQLQKYFTDKINSKNDPTAAAEAQAIEDGVKKSSGGKINLANLNHQDVVKSFMQAYPTVFGLTTTGPQGTNALLPNQDSLDANAGGSGIGG